MAQASQRSLITPPARYISSSVFSFSPLALCVGGFLKPSEGEKKKERKKQLHTSTETQAAFFLTKSNGFMTLTSKNNLFREPIFLSDLRRRRSNLKVAYRGQNQVKLDHLPQTI